MLPQHSNSTLRQSTSSNLQSSPATSSPLRTSQHSMEAPSAGTGSSVPLLTTTMPSPDNHPPIVEPVPTHVYNSMPARPSAVNRLSAEQLPTSPSPVRRTGTGGNEMTFYNPAPQYGNSKGSLEQYRPVGNDFAYSDSTHPPHSMYGALPGDQQQQPHPFGEDPNISNTALPQQTKWRSSGSYAPQQRHRAPSMRSARLELQKRNSYRFDALSDIDDESRRSTGGEAGGDRRSRMSQYPYRRDREVGPPTEVMRLPLTWWMNSEAKNRMLTDRSSLNYRQKETTN